MKILLLIRCGNTAPAELTFGITFPLSAPILTVSSQPPGNFDAQRWARELLLSMLPQPVRRQASRVPFCVRCGAEGAACFRLGAFHCENCSDAIGPDYY